MTDLPTKKEKTRVTVEIENELLKRVRDEIEVRQITLRQAAEYGLKMFLDQVEVKERK